MPLRLIRNFGISPRVTFRSANRLVVLLLALAVGSLLGAAPIRIGVEPLAEQLSHLDSQGRPVGFAVDITQAVARDQALEVELVTKPWVELLEDFRAARIEVLAAVGATPERDAFMAYSTPHVDLRSAMFTRRDFKVPSDIGQLGQAVFGTTPKSLSHDYLVRHGWNNIRNFPSLQVALQALDRGECDLVLAVGIIARRHIREAKLTRIVETDFDLPDLHFELRFGVAPENRALLYRLNNGLARLRSSPAYDQIYEKWIGVLEPRRIRLRDAQPYLIALGALALAVAAAFLWQRRLLQRLARQADELRQRQEQLTLVLEGSDDAFWDWDIARQHVERSERWASMLGYTLREIDHSPDLLHRLIHPDDLASYEAHCAQIRAGERDRFQTEFRAKAKSGEWRWILDRGKIVTRAPDGRALRMAGTHTDITDRKTTEAALAESQSLLRRSAQLLEQTQSVAHVGGWEVDLSNDHVYWTHETHLIHETAPATFRPTVENAIQFYAPESRPIIAAAVEQAVLHGTPYELELELVTARRRRIRVHTTGRAEHSAGRIVKIYGSFHDITALRAAEDEREKLRLKMLEAQKLESLGILAGGIAHDFNNLLTIILANASFARPSLPAAEHESLAHIETAARRAADLCRQMLAYAGRGNFHIELVDPGDLVREFVSLLTISISKKARLKLDLADNLPRVEADAVQLRQVVMNLVINASEALGDQPGEIRLATRMARPGPTPQGIRHSFDLPEGPCICLEIADTGPGMTAPTLARIFDPFYTTKFTGRGLGLAAVLGIVRSHRGALTVDSSPGNGAVFRLYLPVSNRPPLVSPQTAITNSPRHRGGKILIADDEPAILATTDAMLRQQGYHTVLAGDGHGAVKQFQATPEAFAAVILDLTMPGLDGAEVLRSIRAINPATRALVMSGYSEEDILARLRGLGEVAILRKPFTQETLLERLAAIAGSGPL